MARSTRFDVPTKVILDQCRVVIDTLSATANAGWVAELKGQGLDPNDFVRSLRGAHEETMIADTEQERLKDECLRETRENQAVAEEGYGWIQRVQARGRQYLAGEEVDRAEVAGRLRFGKLHAARSRGVIYEMRLILPELAALKAEMKPYGLTDALIAEGKEILKRLGAEHAETAEVEAKRERATEKIRAVELKLTRLLDRLVAADEGAALERPENEVHVRLDLIAAERGRVEGMRRARLAKQPANGTPIEG